MVNFTKFMLYFKVDEDPELYELLSEAICKKIAHFTADQLLTMMVNYNQSLQPSAIELCRVINEEFCVRLHNEHNPIQMDVVLQPEDLIKVTTTMLEYQQMHETLKNGINEYIGDNLAKFTFEVTSELAVIYASKMDETYKKLFFEKTKDKMMRELRHLKDDTLYKIVWSLVKARVVIVSSKSSQWTLIKDAIVDRSAEISPKVMSDLLVLSTMESTFDESESPTDLFSKVENDLMRKMKFLNLDDLINMLWTALKINKGSSVFYERLENEISKRIRGIKDE